MKLRDIVSFCAFLAIIVVVLGYFASLGLRVKPPDNRINLSMDVADMNGVVVGSNVLLRGVPVGKVTGTEASLQAATINFFVDGRYRVPQDSEVRLENLSALGESYIGLVPRSAGGPMLRDGQHIATNMVAQPASISELATSVVRVLDQLDPPALKRIIGETNAALPDPAVVLPNLSRAATLLRNTVADFHGSGRAVLDNFQALLEHADYVGPALVELTPSLGKFGIMLQDLIKGIPLLVHRGEPDNINNLNRLMARVQGFLDTSGADLKILGEALLPKLNTISAALMNFDTSQILDNALAAVPPDGIITLRVVP